ncbi:MAG: UDP-N-acetylmuramoyl-L-alanyl-D-glutamate--2,6-diaminopimelate ligase [Bacteroidota bacterium]
MAKYLTHIFSGIAVESIRGSMEYLIESIEFDSRKACSSSIFFAIQGTNTDGHLYLQQVVENGCQVIVVQKLPEFTIDNCTVILVRDSLRALALASSNFFDNPSKKLKIVGVTGTNGKTTIATLLHSAFTNLGYACGLLSTVVNKIGQIDIPATHTTPDSVQLNRLLAQMVDSRCEYVFMEVSSHAIHQERIGGLTFTGAIFSNITHDHLDYHKTFAEYRNVKKRFFDELNSSAFSLTNCDDKNGMIMLQNTLAKKYTYALKSPADFKVKVLENQFSGMLLNINGKEVWTKLIGEFNASNVLAIYATGILLNQDEFQLLQVISSLESVSGRFQYLKSKTSITAIVDYAHTPDALENVLSTIASIRKKEQKVLTIVGCGGDRDSTKRPEMARIASEMSDQVILTSDNPRSEDPHEILNQMMKGILVDKLGSTLSISDRAQAIKTAVVMSNPNDIILIAGKGHEKYQEIQGIKYDFDDVEITKSMFDLIGK